MHRRGSECRTARSDRLLWKAAFSFQHPHDSPPRLTLEEFKLAGIDTDELAGQLQREGGDSFKTSWYGLLDGLDKKLERFAASDAR
jgi:hypothetical protein